MIKQYQVVYTACVFEEKKFKFSDGTFSTGWTYPTDLWPNKVRSQVFNELENNCPVIVQIGANDGVSGEYYGLLPFLEGLNNFKLFLIEPQKKYIKYLKEIYGKFGNKVEYLNLAITEKSGKCSMTNRENCAQIVSEKTHDFIDDGQRISVDSISWVDFLEKYNINTIDILLMDCEGYELNIINQFSDSEILPKRIRYEYPHINNQDYIDTLLNEKGYSLQYCLTDPCWDKVAVLGEEKIQYNISPHWSIPKSIL